MRSIISIILAAGESKRIKSFKSKIFHEVAEKSLIAYVYSIAIKISPKLREEMSCIIKRDSLFWGIGIISVSEIDKINILNASIKAMHLAIESIIKKMRNDTLNLLLIDGNRFKKYNGIEHKCIIKGDSKYSSIAAASILAKTHRD